MICPDCQAEYLNNIKICGDCKRSLVDASSLDIPIPEMTWTPLPTIIGSTYSNIITDLLNKKQIPHYVKSNWSSTAFNASSTNLNNDVVRIFVPDLFQDEATNIVNSIIGDTN